MSASIEQIWNIVASRPKFVFPPTFIFCSPICSNNCGVDFLRKYILVFEKWLFSFDHSNIKIFTVNITRVVWPHVTNLLDLRSFCEHNPLFYLLNLILCRYWSWQQNIFFLVNIFYRRSGTFVTWGHTTPVIFTVKICIFERSNEKSNFSKTKMNFYKKNYTKIIRTYWATKNESGRENELWATCRCSFDECWH